MLAPLAAFIYRRRLLVLATSTLFLVGAIAMVTRGGALTGGAYGSGEAFETERLATEVLGHPTTTTFVAIFHSDTLAPRDTAFRDAMKAALAPVGKHGDVLAVTTPDDAPLMLAQKMVNERAKSAIALVDLRGTYKEALSRYPAVRAVLRSNALTITCTGKLPFMHDFDRVLSGDVLRAELISLPLAMLVLLLAFRTGVAAALPVGVGALAVVGGMAVVLALSKVMDIAEYAINICSLIGLGVAIDYSLFTVSRYREELAAGHDYPEALARALDGAGRVVLFSGLVLMTGLAGLLFFTGSFLFAMGIAGVIVVTLAVVFALTFLPALLAVLGPRIHALALPAGRLGPSEGFWHRQAMWVMRRPVTVLVPVLALLVFMGTPFLRLEMTEPDVRVLGPSTEARRGYDLLQRDFPELGNNRIIVAVRFPSAPALTEARIGALYDLAARTQALPHVRKVESIVSGAGLAKETLEDVLVDPPPEHRAQIEAAKKLTVGERVVLLYVLTASTPESHAAQDLVRALRRERVVADGTLSVGGQTAVDMDATEFVRDRTPFAMGFIMAATFAILFLLLGSVVLPLEAVLMNLLSVTGSFGALVWVFQEGHLGLAEPRPIEHALPVLLFCVLFGLSMDYEVLMLSRIKESYERTRDNSTAVAEGLEKAAPLITSAAAIMVVVFAAFLLASVVLLRAVGFGMALAVFVDATLVRLLLVPATMRLFGRFNWWAPRVLVRLRAALGFH